MSPYLFIICMKLLSRRINYEVDTLNWILLSISKRGSSLLHLFFADDLTLFARADHQNCLTINRIIQCFSSHSGQRVNFSKSKVLFSKNCDLNTQNDLSSFLGIHHSNNFDKYLGFLFFTKILLRLIFNSS